MSNNNWSTFEETSGYQRQIIDDARNAGRVVRTEMEKWAADKRTAGWVRPFREAAQAWLDAGGKITNESLVDRLLGEDCGEGSDAPEEKREVQLAKNILAALKKLGGSEMSNTGRMAEAELKGEIEAAANELIKMHGTPACGDSNCQ